MLLLNAMQSLIKSTQLRDFFVCDFRDIIKICEGDVYYMYYDSEYYFQDDLFISFLVAINFVQENINI